MTDQTQIPEDPEAFYKLAATSFAQSIDAMRVAQGKVSISKLKVGTPEFEEAEMDTLRLSLIALGEDPDDDSDDFLNPSFMKD